MYIQGNLSITEPGLSHTDLGTCTPRQLSRACFCIKWIWRKYGILMVHGIGIACSSYSRHGSWQLFHKDAWIALYGFDGNRPRVPTANNNAWHRLETWFRYGHVLRNTFSWRLPGIIHVKLSHYDFGDKASFPVWLSSPSQWTGHSIHLSVRRRIGRFLSQGTSVRHDSPRRNYQGQHLPLSHIGGNDEFQGEKYVRSMPNESRHDNLLNLPRVWFCLCQFAFRYRQEVLCVLCNSQIGWFLL